MCMCVCACLRGREIERVQVCVCERERWKERRQWQLAIYVSMHCLGGGWGDCRQLWSLCHQQTGAREVYRAAISFSLCLSITEPWSFSLTHTSTFFHSLSHFIFYLSLFPPEFILQSLSSFILFFIPFLSFFSFFSLWILLTALSLLIFAGPPNELGSSKGTAATAQTLLVTTRVTRGGDTTNLTSCHTRNQGGHHKPYLLPHA